MLQRFLNEFPKESYTIRNDKFRLNDNFSVLKFYDVKDKEEFIETIFDKADEYFFGSYYTFIDAGDEFYIIYKIIQGCSFVSQLEKEYKCICSLGLSYQQIPLPGSKIKTNDNKEYTVRIIGE